MHVQFRKSVILLQSAVALIAAQLGVAIIGFLKAKEYNVTTVTLGVLIISLIAIRYSEATLFWVIDNNKWLRRRLFGRNFVEGYWFDAVYRPEEGKIREYGLIEIRFEELEFIISGTLYNDNFQQIGQFSTKFSKFSKPGPTLEYAYERRAVHDRMEIASGIGEYKFLAARPYPLTFDGTFFDPALDKPVSVFGQKIDDPNDENTLFKAKAGSGAETQQHWSAIVKKYANDFSRRRPELTRQSNSVPQNAVT